MGLIIFLIIGGLAGWLASMIVRGGGLGVVGDIVVGIIGAFLGGLLFGLVGLGGNGLSTTLTSFTLSGFLVAVVGAVVLLLVVHLLTGSRGRRVNS
jgi:uncharacterized membrane protein YeaQ/YmgE (transglycosylase-associated protein family)